MKKPIEQMTDAELELATDSIGNRIGRVGAKYQLRPRRRRLTQALNEILETVWMEKARRALIQHRQAHPQLVDINIGDKVFVPRSIRWPERASGKVGVIRDWTAIWHEDHYSLSAAIADANAPFFTSWEFFCDFGNPLFDMRRAYLEMEAKVKCDTPE